MKPEEWLIRRRDHGYRPASATARTAMSMNTLGIAGQGAAESNQNRKRIAICTIRGEPAEEMTPKVDEPNVVPGFPKLVWFSVLNASKRISAAWRSATRNCFARLRSRVAAPGPNAASRLEG